jgi:DNA-binding IclR family transcriptional regulator
MLNLFGSESAEKVLLYIQNYGRGNSNEIARAFDMSQSMAWKQLLKFEREGVLVSSMAGRTRVFEVNPRYAFKAELAQLLEKGIELLPEAQRKAWCMQRRRPRRAGKPL